MAGIGMTASAAPKPLSLCLGRARTSADDPMITGITLDSRRVRAGYLFAAIKGERDDGHAYIADAIARGASAVISDRRWAAPAATSVTFEAISDLRLQIGAIAARFHDDPSRALGCVGVTGTNGKTSVAWYVRQLLDAHAKPAAYAGTLGWHFGDQQRPTVLTTEDPVTVQARLAELRCRRAEWVAMEVSSHALAQHRVDAVAFDVAVLTNLSRDHLDYHGTMERYAAAKRRLFEFPSLTGIVVNADDVLGVEIAAAKRRSNVELLGFGSSARASVRWDALRFHQNGIAGELHTPWGRHAFDLPLYGDFSVANVVAASCAVTLAGGSFAQCLDVAHKLAPPPGRMQFVRRPQHAAIVIDYAHTPDALAKAMAALRHHVAGRLICVFGCGGDRDRGKRPLMAAAAEQNADAVWVTSDNPRTEAPEQIAADIMKGFRGRVPALVELDRARAIAAAIGAAGTDDLVLIAGKGHEDYQEIHGERLPFSDVEQVLRLLDAGRDS
jgi:UDP-N-acetylmuramoyl-L-alanyl-D-glutamate--2,6-diaminopimelate ligase